jgi:hypothetical protein
MSTAKRLPLITLGWQAWGILAVVLAFLLAAVAFLMFG